MEQADAVRVAVVEDSLVAREGMVALVRSLPRMLVVGTAHDLPSARATVRATAPDVMITDLRMPPGHHSEGIALAKELGTSHPHVAVVVACQHCEPHQARHLFEQGAEGRGYILKDRIAEPATMMETIETVTSGGVAIDPSIVASMVVDGRGSGGGAIAGLSPREAETLGLIAAGKSNGAIARSMGISRRAVEKNTTRIFTKLRVADDDDTNRRVAATLLWLESRAHSD